MIDLLVNVLIKVSYFNWNKFGFGNLLRMLWIRFWKIVILIVWLMESVLGVLNMILYFVFDGEVVKILVVFVLL